MEETHAIWSKTTGREDLGQESEEENQRKRVIWVLSEVVRSSSISINMVDNHNVIEKWHLYRRAHGQ